MLDGAPERDLSDYRQWRGEAEPENMALIEFYGSLLLGQYAGMTTALCLTAVASALALAQVDPAWRLYFATRLVRLHVLYEHAKPKPETT